MFDTLRSVAQWVGWRIEADPAGGKPRKIPVNPWTGGRASTTDPATWGTLDQVRGSSHTKDLPVGFVFTAGDPWFFVDIDHCLAGGAWTPLALRVCEGFQGAYVEVSQSGEGLHIVGCYTSLPPHTCKNVPRGLELYSRERFVALTGAGAMGSPTYDHTQALAAHIEAYHTPVSTGPGEGWTTEPRPEWAGPSDDNELLGRALASTSAATAFGAAGKASFAELWSADPDALGRAYPDADRPYDASSADQALANQLAFWTGGDCARIERLMCLSMLARGKWEDRPEYLETTILNACRLITASYQGRGDTPVHVPSPPPAPPTDDDGREVATVTGGAPDGEALCSFDQQKKHFAECIYVIQENRIQIHGGMLLNKAQFDATFGGKSFVLSPDGSKATTSAWEAFTQSQTFIPVRAHYLCFRPEKGEGGTFREDGVVYANSYYKAEHDPVEGDPTKFINHIRKMLPHGNDADILLNYMACVAQNPGRKIQWWPVVQGAQGNFKSTLLRVMTRAVGEKYSHTPNMAKMTKGESFFNGWLHRKLFIAMDEVYAKNRTEFFQNLRTIITDRKISIEGKGVEEVTGDNRANGMIVTNDQDGIPITAKDRRFAPLFCAQQCQEDLARDGMTPEYITDLSDYMIGAGAYEGYGDDYGIKVMAQYLRTVAIDERYNPLRAMARCPETSSTKIAHEVSLGPVEQDIQEACRSGQTGFTETWVSSYWLDRLLTDRRYKIPHRSRRAIMQSLGYDWHPQLPDGRATRRIPGDGGTVPRLYCKVGSIRWHEGGYPGGIADAYERDMAAQGPTAASAFAA